MTEIAPATAADMPEVARLFREYAAWVGVDLSFQDFSSRAWPVRSPAAWPRIGGAMRPAR